MTTTTNSFFIENDEGDFFCCSPQAGFYFSDDIADPNIVDGSKLELKFTAEDTIKEIREQVKEKKGTQYSRKDLFKHPDENAWLACERRTVSINEENEKVKEYCPFWTRRYKLITGISRTSLKCQGNAAFKPGSKAAKIANEKARLAKKTRLANATETARNLNFDPLKRLALYAMGDKDGLGLTSDVTQATQLKAIETYLKYSHQQLKPYSPQEADKLKHGRDDLPVVHVTLPSNDREMSGSVLSHDSRDDLNEYLRKSYLDEYETIDHDAGEFDEKTGSFILPNNGR